MDHSLEVASVAVVVLVEDGDEKSSSPLSTSVLKILRSLSNRCASSRSFALALLLLVKPSLRRCFFDCFNCSKRDLISLAVVAVAESDGVVAVGGVVDDDDDGTSTSLRELSTLSDEVAAG